MCTQPLTTTVSSRGIVSSPPSSSQNRLQHFKCSKTTGALIVILLWNVLVGFLYGALIYSPIGLTLYARPHTIPFSSILSITLGAYMIVGTVQMLYPIGGLIADVHSGRYKIVIISLFFIWLGFVLTSVYGVLLAIFSDTLTLFQAIGMILSFMLMTVGFSGLRANIIQFSLDQLLDASSKKLSLFLHWFVWTECIGMIVMQLLSAASPCEGEPKGIAFKLIGFVLVLCLVTSTFSLILGYWKRHWFHREKITSNPYQNVYRVLKYAAKHNKPNGYRSALTYSDDEKLPRIDFAKQKYGGPFATEVVEDVKTFLRVLVMLLVIALVFYFDVSTVYIFHIFGLHLGKNLTNRTTCTYEWILFQSGNLSTIFSIVTIPVYIIFVYPLIKKWAPRIITRLGVGIILKVLSVTLMFVFQVVASHNAPQHNNSTCLFLAEYSDGKYSLSPTLELPIQIPVLVVLNLLNGIAAPLINITTFEFISAQSPHTMKGLLLGVFYAFRGLCSALGCLFTLPFTQEKMWGDKSGIFDCGFYYYLSNTLLGFAGLAVFLAVSRWYKYRERDDPPYRHQYVEDYYSRYAGRSAGRSVGRLMEDDNDRVSYGAI